MGHESLPQADRPDSVNDDLVRARIADAETSKRIWIEQKAFARQRRVTESGGKEQPNSRDTNGC
jgi:hypothetical protein